MTGAAAFRSMVPLGVAGLVAAAFLPALSGSFLNWDDDVNFRHNTTYRGFGPAQLGWAFTSVLFGHYIPLTRLTFSLNYALGGLEPRGYHLLNVLLHGLNAALVYLVARRLLSAAAGDADGPNPAGRDAGAVTAALVFGLHPLRVEPVAWITGRADLLCATFLLLGTLAYLRAVRAGDAPRGRSMAVCAACFAAAVLSKGSALPFPMALLVLDAFPLRRSARLGWPRLVREKLPLFALAAVGAAVTAYAARRGAVMTTVADYDPAARISVAAYTFVMPAVRFVWPAALSPLYEMPWRVSPLQPRFAVAIAAAVLITAALLELRRRWPAGLAAWTFSVLMLAPLGAAVRKTSDLAPDRYSYVAGLGFAMLVGGAAFGVARLVARGAIGRSVGWAASAAVVAVVASLGATSWGATHMWTESEILWRWAVELDPACSVCSSKLGEAVLGDPAEPLRAREAEALFRRAIELRPDRPHAYFNLGTALIVQGRAAEAGVPLRSFIDRVPRSAIGHERLGRAYLEQGRYDAAIPPLRTALARQPDLPGIRDHLGAALEGRAGELRAAGLGQEADRLLAEARALGSAQ